MNIIRKTNLRIETLPGRIVQKCVGKDALSTSAKMTMGFARYCASLGPMEPHQHAEEIVYVVRADKTRIRYGGQKDCLIHESPLEEGMVLHIPEMAWHVFEHEEGGSLDIIFFYGQTENIRPEEIDIE